MALWDKSYVFMMAGADKAYICPNLGFELRFSYFAGS